jgi:hypothetical protein
LRSDLHDKQGFDEFVSSAEYAACDGFYILTQTTMLEKFYQRYGGNESEKRATTDDKVQVAGILITDEEMQENLPDLTGKSLAGNRQSLDASKSRKLAGLAMLHRKFIDEEVVVKIPAKWTYESTKRSINEKLGDGVYEQHGTFNANNRTRMQIPWSVKDVTAIFAKVDKEYKTAMDKYTMGTGGGSGANENFAWQERDPTNVVTYSSGSQPCLIYLSVMHMWDKEYSFPYVSVQDSMPADCAIDDDINFDTNLPDETNNHTPTNNTLVRRNTADTTNSRSLLSIHSSCTERLLESMMNGFTHASDEANTVTRKMINVVNSTFESDNRGGSTDQLQPHQIMENITKTGQLIDDYKGKINAKRAARDELKQSTDSRRKKKMKVLKKDINHMKLMVKTLHKTLEHHRVKLDEVITSTNLMENNNASSDSDSDSDSD